jgi:hypothetical protein
MEHHAAFESERINDHRDLDQALEKLTSCVPAEDIMAKSVEHLVLLHAVDTWPNGEAEIYHLTTQCHSCSIFIPALCSTMLNLSC